jgi:hypothetical protein
MFRHYCVILRELVVSTLQSYTSMSNAVIGNTASAQPAYQTFSQNNKYQVSHKYSCFSWWLAHSRPKHVETDKYTKNKHTEKKLCTKLALFTRKNIKIISHWFYAVEISMFKIFEILKLSYL